MESGPDRDWFDEWLELRIPKRFRRATLDSYKPRNPSQLAALGAVRSWIAATIEGTGPMLALAGAQGTGKSHLLYGAVRELGELVRVARQSGIANLQLPRVESWYRLADQLRYSDEREKVRTSILEARILLIDEVRPTASTAFDDTELAKLACHAYDDQVAILITTNVHPLENVMGPAAADRFRTLVVQGPSDRRNP
jgi:chromosomal replication initiation ATPase DnaA